MSDRSRPARYTLGVPRSVVAALLAMAFLALLAVADLAWRLVGAEPPARLPTAMTPQWLLGAGALYVGARRRDTRVRQWVFWGTLGAAILFGTALVPLGIVAAIFRSPLALATGLVLTAAHGAVAYALSRPSAKAWFAPPAGQ